jgi:hypothetical protein
MNIEMLINEIKEHGSARVEKFKEFHTYVNESKITMCDNDYLLGPLNEILETEIRHREMQISDEFADILRSMDKTLKETFERTDICYEIKYLIYDQSKTELDQFLIKIDDFTIDFWFDSKNFMENIICYSDDEIDAEYTEKWDLSVSGFDTVCSEWKSLYDIYKK